MPHPSKSPGKLQSSQFTSQAILGLRLRAQEQTLRDSPEKSHQQASSYGKSQQTWMSLLSPMLPRIWYSYSINKLSEDFLQFQLVSVLIGLKQVTTLSTPLIVCSHQLHCTPPLTLFSLVLHLIPSLSAPLSLQFTWSLFNYMHAK